MKFLGKQLWASDIAALIAKRPLAGAFQGVQTLRRRLFWDRFLGAGKSFAPSSIYIELTNRCNLRCVTCWLYGKSALIDPKSDSGKEALKAEMSVSQVKRILDGAAHFRPLVIFSGGEPLLVKEIADIVGYGASLGLFTSINSNGTGLSEALADDLVRAGLNSISISLDGPQDSNDAIRGAGSFNKSLKGVGNIVKARGGKILPMVAITCTISDFNYDKLSALASVVKDCGADKLRVQHQWFVGGKTYERHSIIFKKEFGEESPYLKGFVTDAAAGIDAKRLIEEISALKGSSVRTQFFPDLSPEEIEKFYSSDDMPLRRMCYAPWFALNVKPNGDATTCPAINYVSGNLCREPFPQVWNGARQRRLRERILKKGLFPGCVRCCGLFA